jgi:CheY-like chemotaxis protein
VPYTLLLADDSVTIQRVIELTFADEDVQVVAVSDGDQAVERIESAPPDIVLADIGMPGRNGYEVARYVKQSPKLSHIPVVLLTGAFEPVDQARAAEVGSDGVLAKPFEPQLVISRVKELLTGQRKSAQPAPSPMASPPAPSPAAPPPPSPSAAAATKSARAAADLDDYFERLDVAFSNLSGGAQSDAFVAALPDAPIGNEIDYFASEQSPPPVAEMPPLSMAPPPVVPSSVADVPSPVVEVPPPPAAFRVVADAPAPEAPQTQTPPAVVDVPPAQTIEATPLAVATDRPAAVVEPQPRPRAELPSLGDAFAAILAAEQATASPSVRPAWPTPPSAGASSVDISDELVERIAGEVLDRLSDRVVRERVTEIVTAIAERLVRQEIERIKSSIK